jgi:hypothetical protein
VNSANDGLRFLLELAIAGRDRLALALRRDRGHSSGADLRAGSALGRHHDEPAPLVQDLAAAELGGQAGAGEEALVHAMA